MTKFAAIVVGTSAGGYNALSQILSGLPANYPIPIVIVQHRARDSEGLFEDMLQRKCLLQVKQADEKEALRPGVVYAAPPDYHLLIEMNGTFSLSSDALVNFSRPAIDVLFESAAQVYRERLVGIILTGSNRDGADGIKAISSLGGLTIAQDPAEAEYGLMPEAAIQTRHIRHQWRLAAIRQFLLTLMA